MHIVELQPYPKIDINAVIHVSCPEESTGQIDISLLSGTAPFDFQWGNNVAADSSLQQLATGNYSLTITDGNGCSKSFDFYVPLHSDNDFTAACTPQWYAPTAFSPNNDGINDRYIFYANERAIRIEQLQIWDRWGNLVFQANDIPFNDGSLGWDGTLKGREMLPAVFV